MNTQKENRTTPVEVSYQLRLSDGSTTDLMMLKYSPLYSATLYLRGDEEVKDKFEQYIKSKNPLENPDSFVIVGMGVRNNDYLPLRQT